MMRKGLLAFLLMTLIVACGEEQQTSTSEFEVRKPRPAVKKSATPQAKEEGAAEEVQEYRYDSKGRRDPFTSLLDIAKPVVVKDEPILTPLQQFDLEQLKIIGVIVGMKEPSAMVVAPDKKSYILKAGTKVGKNSGTVVEISAEGVFVEELYYDFAGEVRKNIQLIKLPEREGVK